MATVNTQALRTAVEAAMDDLVGRIKEEASYRGKVASGGTLAALRTATIAGSQFVVGTLTGPEHWKWVGNGRGPGRMPPIAPLEAWIASKGLSLSAWAVAKKIAAEGSRDYRLKRTNIFMDSIKAWQDGDVLKAIEPEAVKVFGDAYVTSIENAMKPTA